MKKLTILVLALLSMGASAMSPASSSSSSSSCMEGKSGIRDERLKRNLIAFVQFHDRIFELLCKRSIKNPLTDKEIRTLREMQSTREFQEMQTVFKPIFEKRNGVMNVLEIKRTVPALIEFDDYITELLCDRFDEECLTIQERRELDEIKKCMEDAHKTICSDDGKKRKESPECDADIGRRVAPRGDYDDASSSSSSASSESIRPLNWAEEIWEQHLKHTETLGKSIPTFTPDQIKRAFGPK